MAQAKSLKDVDWQTKHTWAVVGPPFLNVPAVKKEGNWKYTEQHESRNTVTWLHPDASLFAHTHTKSETEMVKTVIFNKEIIADSVKSVYKKKKGKQVIGI